MAFDMKLPKLFGGDSGRGARRESRHADDAGPPRRDAQGYDPLASVSMMEQMRAAIAEARMPRKVPLIGHLPIVAAVPGPRRRCW